MPDTSTAEHTTDTGAYYRAHFEDARDAAEWLRAMQRETARKEERR